MPTELLVSNYRAHFSLSEESQVDLLPIKKGASGRTIVRLSSEGAPPVIAIHYTFERDDNALHYPISEFLEKTGVLVPKIYFADLDLQVLLVEDIGKVDLLSLRQRAWEEREPLYRETFTQLARISQAEIPSSLEIMPPFTESTYQWEQEYFAEHFIGTHLGKDPSLILNNSLMRKLSRRLGEAQPDLVHRDFQSQNLMIREGEVYVIDFQGARKGYCEYDLASFIYDPYMKHPLEEREKLRELWSEVSGRVLDSDLMRDCALQRLMQALGAYGNIVHNQKNDWYAQHIDPAVEMLLSLTEGTEYESLFFSLLKDS